MHRRQGARVRAWGDPAAGGPAAASARSPGRPVPMWRPQEWRRRHGHGMRRHKMTPWRQAHSRRTPCPYEGGDRVARPCGYFSSNLLSTWAELARRFGGATLVVLHSDLEWRRYRGGPDVPSTGDIGNGRFRGSSARAGDAACTQGWWRPRPRHGLQVEALAPSRVARAGDVWGYPLTFVVLTGGKRRRSLLSPAACLHPFGAPYRSHSGAASP